MDNKAKNKPRTNAQAGRKPSALDETGRFLAMAGTEESDQFRELMAHLQQVFWIGDSADSIVRYVSPAYETIWGRSCQSLREDATSFADSIVPEDRERMEGAIAGKRATQGYDEEFRILRPDGEMRWIRARSYPVQDERGVVRRFAGIAEDITGRKAAEKERSRLAAIIEYSDGGVVSITPDGIIVGWNDSAERQYGYTAEEIVGCSLSVLFPPGKYPEYAAIIEKVRRGERIPKYDTVRQRKDGTIANVSVGIIPIEVRDGALPGASEIGHDIERIKGLEKQVIEAQRMEVVGKLASGVAHDFNNILSVIMSYAEVLLRALGDDHPTRKYADGIKNAVVRASGLTRQLLLFSRRQPVQPVVLDLNAVVSGAADLLGRLLGEHVTLSIVTDPDIAPVNGDSGYIGQLLLNLAVNARDAMSGGGVLTIATKNVTATEAGSEVPLAVPPGDYVMLSVSDTGCGMTDEVKAHIFEAFFTTKADGTGLGLATCWTIVRQVNAHVQVASELGKGTTFDVYFPAIADVVAVQTRSIQPETLPSGTELILVVEDEPAVREVACTVLESLGYEVLQASNGREGLRVAQEHTGAPIRLVLTDVAMPQMSGKVMAEWMKTSYPDIGILFTSGYTNEIVVRDGVLDADVGFLAKPYTIAELAAKVRGLLDGSS
ncbi:MAG: PAS domain S-box protein [Thermoanaerobaculia bacterium]